MRNVRVLGVALQQPRSASDRVSANLESTLEALDLAADYEPDVVFFPEINLQHRYADDGLSIEDVAEPVPGPSSDAIGERASQLGAYVLSPLIERDGDTLYNSATLLGPDGDVVGTYRKIAPTINEMEEGREPGSEVPAWETEHGTLGALICWDSRYTELGVKLAQQDVNLLLFPTHDSGGAERDFKLWARRYGMHIAYASTESAKVFGPTGTFGEVSSVTGNPVESLSTGGTARLSFATVNTDMNTYGRYQTRGVVDEIQSTYRGKLAFHELHDAGVIAIESVAESPSIADLEREFPLTSAYDPGELDTMFDYEDRTRAHVRRRNPDSPLLDAAEPPHPEADRPLPDAD